MAQSKALTRKQRKRKKLINKLSSAVPFAPLDMAGSLCSPDSNKKTILIVCQDATRTGAPILGLNIAAELQKKHHVITLLLGDGEIYDDFVEASDAVVLHYKGHLVETLLPKILKKICKQTDIQFAIVNSIESRFALPALAAEGIPSILLVHEFAAYIENKEAEIPSAMRLAQKTVFSADIVRDSFLETCPGITRSQYEIIPQGKCRVIPGVKNIETAAAKAEAETIDRCFRPENDDAFIIIGAGSVIYRKGVDLFIDYAAKIMKQRKGSERNVRFIWVGRDDSQGHPNSYSTFLYDQIERQKLTKNFSFAGEVCNIEHAYEKADLMVITSRLDPLPNVAIDAMQAKLPVLCFDKTTGLASILKNSGLGDACVADYLDTRDMAAKTIAFIDSKTHYATVAKCSGDVAEKTFRMSQYVSRLQDLALEGQDS